MSSHSLIMIHHQPNTLKRKQSLQQPALETMGKFPCFHQKNPLLINTHMCAKNCHVKTRVAWSLIVCRQSGMQWEHKYTLSWKANQVCCWDKKATLSNVWGEKILHSNASIQCDYADFKMTEGKDQYHRASAIGPIQSAFLWQWATNMPVSQKKFLDSFCVFVTVGAWWCEGNWGWPLLFLAFDLTRLFGYCSHPGSLTKTLSCSSRYWKFLWTRAKSSTCLSSVRGARKHQVS